MISLEPLGDRAFLASFATFQEAKEWADLARRSRHLGVVDVVLAYSKVAVFADPDVVDTGVLERNLRISIGEVSDPIASPIAGRTHQIPVLYDGEDLKHVSERVGLSIDGVISLHSGRVYGVMAVGFLPGFPYAGELSAELSGLARRDSPRSRVPAGSVAIAGAQMGIYPRESPGGWHLLGRTPLIIADPIRARFPILAGDCLRFVPISGSEFQARSGDDL